MLKSSEGETTVPGPTISVSKLESARRQLQTAIWLWFSQGDPISIHALAYAAHEIIHRAFRKRGLSDLMFDNALIKKEHRKEFADLLKEDANWLKHSNRDTEETETREFNPVVNDLFLSMCVTALLRMGEEMHELELAFNFWGVIHHPNHFPEHSVQDSIPVADLEMWKSLDKVRFLETFANIRRNITIASAAHAATPPNERTER